MIRGLSNALRGGLWRFRLFSNNLEKLPISKLNLANKTDKARHNQMVSLVERMLDLHKRLAAAKTPDDTTKLQRQIDATDHEIDRLVYDLYGLTEEEIKIVEGTAVASKTAECENTNYEDASSSSRHEKAGRQAASVTKTERRSGKAGGPVPAEDSGLGGPAHGVRERTGEYGPPEDPSEKTPSAGKKE